MTIKLLIVDDSRFIRNRIRQILEEEPGFEIVGEASNGREGWLLASQLKPDVITMDVEMPIMDGILSVKNIMKECPTGILMFSSATHAGAQATLDALNAGAIDFLPKQLDEIDDNRFIAKSKLRHRVRMVALQSRRIQQQLKVVTDKNVRRNLAAVSKKAKPVRSGTSLATTEMKKVDLLVLVASTGGPVAIQKVMMQLHSNCSFPIIIVQHMPHKFTKSFADRLNQLCAISVKEAQQGDVLKPGLALLAPGGMQMKVKNVMANKVINICEKQRDEIYSPCADISLSSIAKAYSSHVLTVVLTGMGADGRAGAKELKDKGFSVWAQNEDSCTIYGMPKAIVDANLADQVYSLEEISTKFNKLS